ncbi:MAG: hypothetical protein INR68_07960 [Methylobacterium mesophilicum]|nr:hypothetical protein [Methylobacterium mesophilicum]
MSEALIDLYATDELTLEQLMAFSVSLDHARQEQVWTMVAKSPYREPCQIRRMLTEGAVRASDRRALFVGVAAYEEAGGTVLRNLFQHDDGGWLQDPAVLDRLAIDKLQAEAQPVADEGWKWIEVAIDFPYGHASGLRQLRALGPVLFDEEQAAYDALQTEYGAIEEQYADSPDDLPEDVDQRLGAIEAALDVFHARVPSFEPADIARAGVFVSLDGSGGLKVSAASSGRRTRRRSSRCRRSRERTCPIPPLTAPTPSRRCSGRSSRSAGLPNPSRRRRTRA